MAYLTTLPFLYIFISLTVLFTASRFLFSFLRSRKNRFLPALKVGVADSIIKYKAAAKDTAAREQAHGFMNDVMAELGQRMGRDVAITSVVDSSSCEQALHDNQLDVVVMDGAAAVQRSSQIDVVSCQTSMLNSFALVFWDKVPHHVVSLDDFSYYPNNTTVVLDGSIEHRYLKRLDAIRVHAVPNVTDFIIQLKLGLARAGLMRVEHIHSLRREYSNLKYIPVCMHQHDMLQGERIGVAYRNKKLLGDIEKNLTQMRCDQTMRHLHDKWFAG